MLERAERIVFFLLIFFISSQVGLHFWPAFSYVHGIRIDYLSPTLYLLDILVVVLFLLSAPRVLSKIGNIHLDKTLKIVLTLFLLSLIWNLFNAKSPGAHIFGIIKIVEFSFLGLYVAATFSKKYVKRFIEVLALSAIITSLLAIWQFLSQSSIGGLWYYFGERTFTSSTIGISTVNLDSQILRPYASFPHPNVLAFFLFMVIVFLTFRLIHEKNVKEKVFLSFTILVSYIAVLTTFSRTVIFLLIAFTFYVIYTKGKSNVVAFSLIVTGLFVFSMILFFFPWSRDFLMRGLDFRAELFEQATHILSNNLHFGIGLNNFFIHQAPLVKSVTPILFQPPHNIYLLGFLSLGLFGFWIIPLLFIKAFRELFDKQKSKNGEFNSFYRSIIVVLIGILFVGFFDHFFLTLEQGQIILSLILGLSFAQLNPKGFEKRKGKR